jgi:non-ribosomal peptide synthetase component F
MAVRFIADQVGLAVPLQTQSERPELLQLATNYPNPFNGQTTIQYELAFEGTVSLVLYNAIGQPVRSLFEGEDSSGEHMLQFDAGNLPSGAYYLMLRGHSQARTVQLMLLR